jgi:hypothetical protein
LKEETMTIKRTLAMLPVLVGIGLGAGLGVSAPAAAQTKEVKIGLIAPMSGPWARQGDLMLKGANLAEVISPLLSLASKSRCPATETRPQAHSLKRLAISPRITGLQSKLGSVQAMTDCSHPKFHCTKYDIAANACAFICV